MTTMTHNGAKIDIPSEKITLERLVKQACALKIRLEATRAQLSAVNMKINVHAREAMHETGKKSWQYQGIAGLVEVRNTSDWKLRPNVIEKVKSLLNGAFAAMVSQKTLYGLTPELRKLLKSGGATAENLREIIPYVEAYSTTIKPRE